MKIHIKLNAGMVNKLIVWGRIRYLTETIPNVQLFVESDDLSGHAIMPRTHIIPSSVRFNGFAPITVFGNEIPDCDCSIQNPWDIPVGQEKIIGFIKGIEFDRIMLDRLNRME